MTFFRFWAGVFSLSFFRLGFGGGGGKSSSSSSTTNTDKRQAVQGGAAISGDGSSISIVSNTTDAGLVSRALDSVDKASATNAQGFAQLLDASGDNYARLVGAQSSGVSQLLGTAERLFNQGQALIGQTQKSVADAYSQAQNDKGGTIDNRTIIVLAVAGAAAFAFANRK